MQQRKSNETGDVEQALRLSASAVVAFYFTNRPEMSVSLYKHCTSMTIDEIAFEIIKEQSQFKKELRAAVVRARTIGDLLLKAKQQLPRGEFGGWVKSACEMSHKWAWTCMAIASNWEKIEKHDGVELTIKQAEDVARDKPISNTSSSYSNSIGRLLGVLEERVADLAVNHPEVSDMVDAIHQWRERLSRIGQLDKRRSVSPSELAVKVLKAHKHGYKAKQIHAELQSSGIDVSYKWVRQTCRGNRQAIVTRELIEA